jgi:vancomycin resistance protein YoaR
VFDEKAVTDDLERALKDVGEDPVEARFSVDGGRVVIHPGKDGTRCCAPEAARNLERALLGAQMPAAPVNVPLRPEPPKLSTEDAEKLRIAEPVASFTTDHPAGQPRVRNIHRIADLLRGTVIRPGATFSVNDTVGRRTTAKGFVSAPVIEEGRFSEGVGGGISQFATTLFNAGFFAGLEFPEYQSHSIYISRYPYGREATLNYPRPDLKIRNTTPYGVLIWPSYTERSITVTLYSTKYYEAAQTGQTRAPSGACTRVTTERTRTRVTDGEKSVDRVAAVYRPAEGVNCR